MESTQNNKSIAYRIKIKKIIINVENFGTKISKCLNKVFGMRLWIGTSTFKLNKKKIKAYYYSGHNNNKRRIIMPDSIRRIIMPDITMIKPLKVCFFLLTLSNALFLRKMTFEGAWHYDLTEAKRWTCWYFICQCLEETLS